MLRVDNLTAVKPVLQVSKQAGQQNSMAYLLTTWSTNQLRLVIFFSESVVLERTWKCQSM